MRYGIFSDVHSNLEALEAVAAAYGREGIDTYVCAGDIVGYAANPAECLERVKGMAAAVVAGNHDWACAGKIGAAGFNTYARAGVAHNSRALSAGQKRYLGGLDLVYEDAHCAVVHGSLQDPQEFEYVYDIACASRCLEAQLCQVCFFGHTHIAGVFIRHEDGRVESRAVPQVALEPGKRYLVNVGSVGQPRDGDPKASYCIFDTDTMVVEIHRAAYDWEAAAAKITAAGLPRMLGDRLLEGR